MKSSPPAQSSRPRVSLQLIIIAAGIGIATGIFTAFLRITLEQAHQGRNTLANHLHHWDLGGWGIYILVAMILGGFAVWIAKTFAPETSGSGIQQIEGVLHSQERLRWKRILPIKTLGSISAISSGMILGREGPSVQMGGAFAEGFSKWGKPGHRTSLIAAGAAAGLAAAFNAPLAGFLFMLEELKRKLTVDTMLAGFIACILADTMQQILIGSKPALQMELNHVPPFASLPWMVLIGLVAALFAIPFNKGVLLTLNLFERIKRVPWALKGALVAGIISAVGWFMPHHMLGEGHTVIETTLHSSPTLSLLLLAITLRFLFLLLSYGSGAPGGIFSPLLSLGCILGVLIYEGIQSTGLSPIASRQAFIVVSMAAVFTAIVRAPLTGVIMIVEMTLQDTLLLPLLIATGTAYAVSEFLGLEPIYDSLLKRQNTGRT